MMNAIELRPRRLYRAALLAGGLALIAGTSACKKAPTDQIVAVVNGEEISMQELNAELGNVKLPEGVDKKVVQAQLLQRLVDRRILAQSAKEQGIDKDPNFIVEQRRVNEALLVDKLAKRTADAIPIPGAPEIDKFIAANPSLFAGRQIYSVDQIAFAMPANPQQLKALEPAKTMDAVAATLKTMNMQFRRAVQKVDSASVPPEQMQRILALPKTEPFIIPQGNGVTVNLIVGSEAAPLPTEQARPAAVRILRTQKLAQQGESRLKDAKAKAKIEYQPGFEPKPAATPAKPAVAAK
jgi:peptidyl-prolyl cis-trans isomerase C